MSLNCSANGVLSSVSNDIITNHVLEQKHNRSAPVVALANSEWKGLDGQWTPFDFRIGSSRQRVQAFVSTSISETWTVWPNTCTTSAASTCANDHGGLFAPNQSTSWVQLPCYQIPMPTEYNISSSGSYGLDTIGIGFADSEGPSADYQVIAGVVNTSMAMFGIGRKPGNFTPVVKDPIPSFLSSLRDRNIIPSLSWSYTAGAHYRSKGVPGSLIFGGYDTSKYISNNVTFDFGPNDNKDLMVGVQSIKMSSNTGSSAESYSFLPSGIFAHVDSTLPYLWLPPKVCGSIADALGLTWSNKTNLYTVNSSTHDNLLLRNPTFTFTLSNQLSGGQTFDINLPYAAFDLQMKPPLVPELTYYFPIKQAPDESQWTLGRAFLQEAYVTVNYQESKFKVSACNFSNAASKIVAINETLGEADVSPMSKPSRCGHANCIAGSTVGAVIIVAIIVGLVLCIWRPPKWRRLASLRSKSEPDSEAELARSTEPSTLGISPVSQADSSEIAEINGRERKILELSGTDAAYELHGTSRVELPATPSTPPEKDLPEKDLSEMIPELDSASSDDTERRGRSLSRHT